MYAPIDIIIEFTGCLKQFFYLISYAQCCLGRAKMGLQGAFEKHL